MLTFILTCYDLCTKRLCIDKSCEFGDWFLCVDLVLSVVFVFVRTADCPGIPCICILLKVNIEVLADIVS